MVKDLVMLHTHFCYIAVLIGIATIGLNLSIGLERIDVL